MMTTNTSQLHPERVTHAQGALQEFQRVTTIPHPVRHDTRGSAFDDPSWLIMCMAVRSVTERVKHNLASHRLAVHLWDILAEGLDEQTHMKPFSASPLRHQ
jgi:hypothetical protein